MKVEALITAVLLLSLSCAELEEKMISFSRGVQLIVKAIKIRTVAPKVQILAPVGLQTPTSERVILTCVIRELQSNQISITWKINNTVVSQKHSSGEVFKQPDGTFTALGFYFVPLHDWRSDDVYRCEVKQEGVIYYEEVWHSLCDQYVS
ncbi:Ig lambda chain C region [Pygocentrus nattereri]|uniref:Ig-like domain-containing protein n=1 Tax=Pygocentrus nattereri TaxID=42514 RepID=A0A3B4DXH6_PYGNA|nr:Ig lambda chain C region [Pygocentrus nattereri]